MSTATLPSPPQLPSRTVLGRSLAAEWTRLWTVRSTWWSLLAATSMMLLVGFAFGLDVGQTSREVPVWVAGELGIVFAQFALLVPVMLSVTAEYSTGAIRSTLQAVPRRGVLALSRTLVTVAVATVAGVALTLAADLASWVTLGEQAELVIGDVVASVGAVAAVVAAGSIMTVALGAALRSSAGTLTTMFMLWLVLPAMLPGFGVEWLATIGRHLPGTAGLEFLDALGDPTLTATRAVVVLAAWLFAVGAAGLWSLTRRDAA